MENWRKKVLSIIIAMTMIISTLTPINAYANETYNYGDWEYIVVDGNITITGYVGKEVNIIVPEVIDGKKVTVIGERVCRANDIVENVILPESVTTIEYSAFSFCDNLKNITIPSNVTNIDCLFKTCCSLLSINVASDNKIFSSKDGVLYDKKQSLLLSYPPAKKSDNFIVPNSVKKIGKDSFAYSTGLKGITIPKNVTYIEDRAFYKCEKLINVTLPNTITTIESGTFYNCKSLTNITIPESVNHIDDFAFEGCYSLSSITIPPNVKKIDERAFSGCVGLKEVNLSKTLSEIGWGCFYGCTSLTSVTIPESVNKIGTSAFAFCKGLSSITIPASVNKIEARLFAFCEGLSSITIPPYVTSIERDAFNGCVNLKTVKFMGEKPSNIDEKAFDSCSPELTILYPQRYKDSWASYTDHPKLSYNDIGTPVSKISLNKKKIILSKGKTYRLKRRIKPIDADIKSIRWKSSNKKIATVSKKGLVKAKKVGTCTITVISKNGNKKAKCKVRVVLPVKKVKLSAEQISIKKGSKYTLKATVKPKKSTIKKVIWNSSNEKVAKVSKGVVTGVKKGTCYITVKSKQGNKKARCKVVVK